MSVFRRESQRDWPQVTLQVAEWVPRVRKPRFAPRCLPVCWNRSVRGSGAGQQGEKEKRGPSLNSLGPNRSEKNASVTHLFPVSNLSPGEV